MKIHVEWSNMAFRLDPPNAHQLRDFDGATVGPRTTTPARYLLSHDATNKPTIICASSICIDIVGNVLER